MWLCHELITWCILDHVTVTWCYDYNENYRKVTLICFKWSFCSKYNFASFDPKWPLMNLTVTFRFIFFRQMTLKWLLWSKIDFFGQNWPNDTFLDYFELVIPGCDSNWMFQTESNGIKLTQMTHLEHHVTHHVTNNLKFESSYLVNQIKWIIQSATSLKTDNLSKRSLSRTRTHSNPNVVDW